MCQKTKRVRRLPDNVTLGADGRYTDGVCRWHNSGVSRAAVNSRVRVMHTPTRKAASTPPAPTKSGGRRA